MEKIAINEGDSVIFDSPEMHARRTSWDVSPRSGKAKVAKVYKYPDGRFRGFTLNVELPHGGFYSYYYTADEINLTKVCQE
jgi:hypothetical protein